MTSKRSTPQSKGQGKPPSSTSRYRTPNSNTSLLERRGTAPKPKTSSSKPPRAQSYMDLTGLGNTSVCPGIKMNLMNSASFVDYEVDCDCDYSDYLQAFMKRQILLSAIDKKKEEVNDQLVIQRDNLYKSQQACEKVKQELAESEKLDEVDELTRNLDTSVGKFSALSENVDLEGTLEQLLQLFNVFCNRVSVKHVKVFQEQEDYDKLKVSLEKCSTVLKRMNLSDRNADEVGKLAETMNKYQRNVDMVAQHQKFINNAQSNEVWKLFKYISDVYAEKEKY